MQISRRDLILISSGVAVICCALIADRTVNGHVDLNSESLTDAVQRLQRIPAEIEAWTSVDHEISEREQDAAGIVGYVRRTYTNRRTGAEIQLTVLCGPSGPIAVHPPTACFEGIGYTIVSGPTQTRLKSDDKTNLWEFNKSSFRQGDASVPDLVRVFWAWSPNGQWKAPSAPRLEFRGQPFLYKIYVTDSSVEESGKSPLPQIEAFLKDALPVIQPALEGKSAPSALAMTERMVERD